MIDARVDGVPAEEPVLAFRADEVIAPAVAEYAGLLARRMGADDATVDAYYRLATEMRAWQATRA
jgi:hypothetical protein